MGTLVKLLKMPVNLQKPFALSPKVTQETLGTGESSEKDWEIILEKLGTDLGYWASIAIRIAPESY